jgi:hypothetical protein
MRLLSAVRKLELVASGSAAAAPAKVGIAWTSRDVRIDASELREGQFIAVDITCEVATKGAASTWWSVVERVTYDPEDLGHYYEVTPAGLGVPASEPVRVGTVVSIDGDLVRYDLHGGGSAEMTRGPAPEFE